MQAHDEWLMAILTRPATVDDYFFTPDIDPPHATEAEFADHLAWLLDAPGAHMAPYDDLSVAAGLRWIFDSSEPLMFRCIGAPGVTQDTRIAIAAGLVPLFSEVIAPRCPQSLGHRSEDGGPLALTAYMFFDLIWIDPPGFPAEAEALDAAMIEAMGAILALPHAACQEAALHGLGHWHDRAPGRASALIDDYLAGDRAARPELVVYARAARTGCVL
ncbi:hypothetical protein H0I76_01925 [Limibaculum sp. M0105]|uniref:Uncharacterized protein n=1 Tax=Thermohalobaculum xanthum TaxID=2753746 RepID=A0A8J7M491_9RHOB|nr:hypothetical protein [Thermohalobaculum xanthum]MBK0397934.1 hypothetical protein [Thermohalobaculum xanthum]